MSIVIELTWQQHQSDTPGASVQDNPSPPMTHSSTPLTSCLKALLNNTILLECLSMLSFHTCHLHVDP
ncbi:hypothetical protein DPMN_020081 [Dreissena polymorpha]|uniref:Uncharacterized protein n=1 Tax=Dreissena polymorpha TaxID=45954 RepID=A0A9D4NJQ4_DREPO|nr:hypothetical protein DPMN_020081 [Dreissena polymorpha]